MFVGDVLAYSHKEGEHAHKLHTLPDEILIHVSTCSTTTAQSACLTC